MPGKDIKYDWMDVEKHIKEFTKKDIWISPTEQEQIEIDRMSKIAKTQMDDIFKQFKYEQQKKPVDPVDKLRDEMRKELVDIKKAIHTIGILLDGDKPSDEMLEKHKTLRDAYRKYKMIEALILGQQE